MEAAVQNEIAFVAINGGVNFMHRRLKLTAQTRTVIGLITFLLLLSYNISGYVLNKPNNYFE